MSGLFNGATPNVAINDIAFTRAQTKQKYAAPMSSV